MKRFLLLFLPFFLMWGGSRTASASFEKLEIQPSSFARNLLGTKTTLLTLQGAVPEGARIVINVAGPERDFKLNKSGRVFGFLWAPVRLGVVSAVPAFFAVLSSEKGASLFPPEERNAAGIFFELEEWAARGGKVIFPEKTAPEETERLSREFLQGLILLLREKGLYLKDDTAIRMEGGRFEARLRLPVEAPLGEYRVFVYAVKEGRAGLLDRGVFSVRSEGLAAWLARQARENPFFYGIMAVLIALAAGAFVGIIFQLGRGR